MKFAAFGLVFLVCLVCRLHGQPRGLVIITDMEPDDRIALAMVAASKLA
uniref:Secreted protein n=1 Tax=Globodera pallida TaxID=36090 RepID=A0A183CRJ4_GLOPA